jgi:hypothetical protein
METAIVTSLISGIFALATSLGSVWLKHHLEQSGPPPVAPPVPQQRVPGRQSLSALRPVFVLVISFAAGAVYSKFKSTGSQETMALMGLYTFIVLAFAGLVLTHRRSSSGIWPYQLDCLALWAAFASGFSLVHGRIWSDLIVGTVMFWSGFALVGGLIVWFTRPTAAKPT